MTSCSRGLRAFICRSCEFCRWPVLVQCPTLSSTSPETVGARRAMQAVREAFAVWAVIYLPGLSQGGIQTPET